MEETLKKKVVKGTFWVFISQITTQFIALVKNIIIARILSPDVFGLFGIALISLSLFEVFSQTGFDAALIQKKENIEDYLDTAFVVNILRGGLLFILLFFSAPYVGTFFENTLVTPIVRIISFTFLINGFINPGTIYFVKELDFKKQFYWDMSGTVTGIIVTLSIIFFLRDVWVLVIAAITSHLARALVSYLIHSFRPKFRFRKQYALNLFKFGKWVLASSVLIYLLIQGDDAFVGKVLGVTWLGFYRMAYRFSNLPATHITKVISRVSFPAYSKLQDDIPKLRDAYLKVLRVTAFFTIPIAGLIFALAPDFTKIFLGEKWMPMVPAMQVLCFFGVTRSIGATMGPILYSVGRPEIQTKLSSIQLIAMATIIYPLTNQWGILGTSLSVVIPNILALFLITKEVKNILEFNYKVFFRNIIVPIIAVFIMFFVVFLKHMLIPSDNNILNFLTVLALCSITYLGVIYLWDRSTGYKIQYEIHQIFTNLGGK